MDQSEGCECLKIIRISGKKLEVFTDCRRCNNGIRQLYRVAFSYLYEFVNYGLINEYGLK